MQQPPYVNTGHGAPFQQPYYPPYQHQQYGFSSHTGTFNDPPTPMGGSMPDPDLYPPHGFGSSGVVPVSPSVPYFVYGAPGWSKLRQWLLPVWMEMYPLLNVHMDIYPGDSRLNTLPVLQRAVKMSRTEEIRYTNNELTIATLLQDLGSLTTSSYPLGTQRTINFVTAIWPMLASMAKTTDTPIYHDSVGRNINEVSLEKVIELLSDRNSIVHATKFCYIYPLVDSKEEVQLQMIRHHLGSKDPVDTLNTIRDYYKQDADNFREWYTLYSDVVGTKESKVDFILEAIDDITPGQIQGAVQGFMCARSIHIRAHGPIIPDANLLNTKPTDIETDIEPDED